MRKFSISTEDKNKMKKIKECHMSIRYLNSRKKKKSIDECRYLKGES